MGMNNSLLLYFGTITKLGAAATLTKDQNIYDVDDDGVSGRRKDLALQ